MTDDLDIKTFDLTEVLTGRGYPEVEVPVYFDESAAFAIYELRQKVRGLSDEDKGFKEANARLEELISGLNDQRYVFTLRGVPMQTQKDLFKRAKAQFKPQEKKGEDIADEAAELYANLVWAAHIVKITAPNGAVQVSPSVETIELLRAKAPAAAQSAIEAGIQELTVGAKAGFERAAQAVDFLSEPSLEG